jgi:polar amino acid transport system substrate-binding protein
MSMSVVRWSAPVMALALLAACSDRDANSAPVMVNALAALDVPGEPADDSVPARPVDPSDSAPSSASVRACVDGQEQLSFAPELPLPSPGEMPAASSMARIVDHGRLRVGVDENTLGFAYRDRDSGLIEGFEVDVAVEIARRIFGADATLDRLELVPVVTSEKTAFVRDGRVDMTISAVTMSCDRWDEVSFSSEYFTARQQFLVRDDSGLNRRDQLADAVVCTTEGSSSSKIMRRLEPDAELVEVPARTDCLVALQEGRVDAYFGHDSFLRGMLAQDPTLAVVNGLFPADEIVSHYGIAIAHGDLDLVRFVNGVLEDLRSDGALARLRDRLETAPLFFADEPPPQAEYLPS